MKLLITGICGFVGSALARELGNSVEKLEIIGIDSLSRAGSELNRADLKRRGARVLHGDIRNRSDLDALPSVDWVIDAAANPSVLAGITAETSSRQLIEHNLLGTINLLEFCKERRAGFLLLSTSRVYSLEKLSNVPVTEKQGAFQVDALRLADPAVSALGVSESFSTAPPVSLYGCAKLTSELLVQEYGSAFQLPYYINRCGVLAGAGQFGKADQGIFSFWIHSFCHRKPLRYIGFQGSGAQVRDCLHPRDLAVLISKQLKSTRGGGQPMNVSGGAQNSLSLRQLTEWCQQRFGPHAVASDPSPRPFDVPWLVLDSSVAQSAWDWKPSIPVLRVLEEIAEHAEKNPGWLELTSGT